MPTPDTDEMVVPDLSDMSCADAVAAIEAIGGTVEIWDGCNDAQKIAACPSADAKVKQQLPPPGTRVSPGVLVTIVVYLPNCFEGDADSAVLKRLVVLGVASTVLSGTAAVFSVLSFVA